MGAAAASLSLRPSLLERDVATQSAITLGSFALGYASGAAMNFALRGVANLTLPGRATPAQVSALRGGVLAAGLGLTTVSWRQDGVNDYKKKALAETAGRLLMVAGAASFGVQLHSAVAGKLIEHGMRQPWFNLHFLEQSWWHWEPCWRADVASMSVSIQPPPLPVPPSRRWASLRERSSHFADPTRSSTAL